MLLLNRILAFLLAVGLSGAGALPTRAPGEVRLTDVSQVMALSQARTLTGLLDYITPVRFNEFPDGPWVMEEGRMLDPGSIVSGVTSAVGMVMLIILYMIILFICVYTFRHYFFTLNRLFGRQKHPYVPIDTASLPAVTVVIPAHNEEAVIGHILDALLSADYPEDLIRIMPVDDRSTDGTRAIIEYYGEIGGGRVTPIYRTNGVPGKSAVLGDAVKEITTEVMLLFDADYVPDRGLIKHLATPFLDPEVGAVMGRVVPVNTARNLLTRLLEMERSGGYQVNQQARMNLSLIPQYGGTVGGVRVSALRQVGGWRQDALAEDTDITLRLVLDGWKIVYSNRYECYEEVPESWPVRIRQIKRWAKGHTDAALLYGKRLLMESTLSARQRCDGLLLLGVYIMAPILLCGWLLAFALFFMGVHKLHGIFAILAVASYNTIGNFAAFFEIAAAVRLDHTNYRIRLLPLNILGFVVSMISVTTAIFGHLASRSDESRFEWKKTERFRERTPGILPLAGS